MEYVYSKTNLLENPQKYQKTSFLGSSFLNEYKISRSITISSLKTNKFLLKDFLDSLTTNFKKEKDFFLTDFLHSILMMIRDKSDYDEIKRNLDLVIKKFELRKKLFVKYNADFKEIDSNFNYLRNYLLLSLLCVIHYEKSSSLKYLNSCLKINDTLSSQKIESIDDRILFKYVLEKELEFINQLSQKKRVIF